MLEQPMPFASSCSFHHPLYSSSVTLNRFTTLHHIGEDANAPFRKVFPHPALLALCDCDYRIPYKVQKTRRYWPNASANERRCNLIQQMQAILAALSQEITEIPLALESSDAEMMTIAELKALEDMIDALVCAWTGIKYLAGEADPYGDESAAIWVPRRRVTAIA